MTTNEGVCQGHHFIVRAQELYQTDPLAAAVMLTDGINDLLESHGLTLSLSAEGPNGDIQHPGIPLSTIPQQELDAACRNLARTARDAAARMTPERDEWETDVGIAQSAIWPMAQVHG